MAKQTLNNIKLGVFVVTGLAVIIISLYIIGRNKSFFGSSFELHVRFRNVAGLMKGNNVRFSGIQAGTVKDIVIVNDTTIEVTMLINNQTKNYIRKNSLASIGSEGLMGNKIINIEPNSVPAPVAEENDMLIAAPETRIDAMLQTLDVTNRNIAVISEDLKETMQRINDSKVIKDLLNDTTLSESLRASLLNINQASVKVNSMASTLDDIIQDVNNGNSTAGLLLKDTGTARNFKDAIAQINDASHEVNNVIHTLNNILNDAGNDLKNGNGLANVILKDSTLVNQLQRSLSNIEKGTAAFNEDMEALKHNFLIRGYFKKKAKQAAKE